MVRRKTLPHINELRDEFYNQYAFGFLESCNNFLELGLNAFVSPRLIQNCFKYIFYALQVPNVEKGLASHLDRILLDLCIPMLAMNQKDEENWIQEPSSFLYAQDCRLDGHNNVKYASKDLSDAILKLNDHQGIPMLVKLLEFTRLCFEQGTNVRSNQPVTAHFKECLISMLIHCYKYTVDNDAATSATELLVEHWVVKELFSDLDIIKARVCTLLTNYGADWIVHPDSLMTLCKGLEQALSSNNLVVQITGIVALNRCTANEKVCDYFSNHLNLVFELIVKCMNAVDYKELVYAGEGLIKDFGDKLLPFSVVLLKHFNTSFYQYMQHSKSEADTTDDDIDLDDDSEMEANLLYESIYAAEACLEAILSILQLNLPDEIRQEANNMILCMISDVIMEANSELFSKALGLLNFVLYKATTLNDAMKFFFPVLCYVLGSKPNAQLNQSAACLPENFLRVLTEVDLSSLNEYAVTHSLGCILNFIAKLGSEFYTSVDYFGFSFVDLLFETMVKTIKDALTDSSDMPIIFMNRILIGMLEQSRDKYEVKRFEDFFKMVIDLSQQNRTGGLKLNILQTVSMFVWHSPVKTISMLRDLNQLDHFYGSILDTLEKIPDEKPREKVLYGLIALLELPADQAQVCHI
jgi:hypothetical protein